MSHLPDSPNATLLDRFHARADAAAPLHRFAHVVMHGPSGFSPALREALAARVSATNGCAFCRAAHAAAARNLGLAERDLDALVRRAPAEQTDPALAPVLAYVDTLNRDPAAVTAEQAAAVLAAGWSPADLETAALVCGFFNLMNRWVEGLGVGADAETVAAAGRMLADAGYAGLAERLSRG